MWTVLLIVFVLNIISNTLGTLKTIFISKKIMNPAYFVIFVDSLVFAYGFKMVATEDSFLLIVAFSAGKVVGAYLADIIENKMAFGLVEVSIFENESKAIVLADSLRKLGFSVTTTKGYGMNGKDRFMLIINLKRKEFPYLEEYLKSNGYSNVNMVVKEVNSVSGKLKERVV